ncbi:MAG TPA: TonB-dependent receptor [Longimicrobiaceae bacterium]
MYERPSAGPVRALLLLAAVSAGAALPAAAQTPADTARADSGAVRLEGVVVRAARSAAVVGGAGAVRLRVDSLPVPPPPRLDQVLRETPFVRVRDNSRGEVELSLRGSDSRQVAVLVDGVPLTLGWDDRADLSLVPMTGAEGLTLVRGVPSVLHGPNVLGGVVEVGVGRSPSGPERESLRVSAGVDHHGARSLAASVASPLALGAGETTVRAGAGYASRSGVPLPGGVADPGADDGLRDNSDLDRADAFLALRHRAPGGAWASFSGFGSRAERGTPPELHLAAPRFWRYPAADRWLAAASAGTGMRRTPLGEGDLEASFGWDEGRTRIESFRSRAYEEVAGREEGNDRTLSLRLLGDHTMGGAADLRAALTLADVRHLERLEPGSEARYRQRLWNAGAEAERRFLAAGGVPRLTVTAGASADGADTPETSDKPPLGALRDWGARLGATLVVGADARLHAGASRRVRFPSLRELYSGALGRFAPNPDLRAEALLAAEAGGTAQLGPLQLQAVGFHHRLEDAIVRASAGGGRFRRENRDEVRSTGVELLADWRGGAAALTGSLTLQRVRVLDPSVAEGSRRPEYQPAAVGGVDVALPLALGITAEAGLKGTGRQWCVHPERGGEVSIAPSARADLRAGRAWMLRGAGALARTLRAFVSLDNAADAAVYDQCGLPQPGRTLRLELRVE